MKLGNKFKFYINRVRNILYVFTNYCRNQNLYQLACAYSKSKSKCKCKFVGKRYKNPTYSMKFMKEHESDNQKTRNSRSSSNSPYFGFRGCRGPSFYLRDSVNFHWDLAPPFIPNQTKTVPSLSLHLFNLHSPISVDRGKKYTPLFIIFFKNINLIVIL